MKMTRMMMMSLMIGGLAVLGEGREILRVAHIRWSCSFSSCDYENDPIALRLQLLRSCNARRRRMSLRHQFLSKLTASSV